MYAKKLYRKNSYSTVTPAMLVLKLYDGARSRCVRAAHAVAKGDMADAGVHLQRTHAILEHLSTSLRADVDAGIAGALATCYADWSARLVRAQLDRDASGIESVGAEIDQIRDALARGTTR